MAGLACRPAPPPILGLDALKTTRSMGPRVETCRAVPVSLTASGAILHGAIGGAFRQPPALRVQVMRRTGARRFAGARSGDTSLSMIHPCHGADAGSHFQNPFVAIGALGADYTLGPGGAPRSKSGASLAAGGSHPPAAVSSRSGLRACFAGAVAGLGPLTAPGGSCLPSLTDGLPGGLSGNRTPLRARRVALHRAAWTESPPAGRHAAAKASAKGGRWAWGGQTAQVPRRRLLPHRRDVQAPPGGPRATGRHPRRAGEGCPHSLLETCRGRRVRSRPFPERPMT